MGAVSGRMDKVVDLGAIPMATFSESVTVAVPIAVEDRTTCLKVISTARGKKLGPLVKQLVVDFVAEKRSLGFQIASVDGCRRILSDIGWMVFVQVSWIRFLLLSHFPLVLTFLVSSGCGPGGFVNNPGAAFAVIMVTC